MSMVGGVRCAKCQNLQIIKPYKSILTIIVNSYMILVQMIVLPFLPTQAGHFSKLCPNHWYQQIEHDTYYKPLIERLQHWFAEVEDWYDTNFGTS